MSVTAGDNATSATLCAPPRTGPCRYPPQSARHAATEAVAQLWQRQDGAIAGDQVGLLGSGVSAAAATVNKA